MLEEELREKKGSPDSNLKRSTEKVVIATLEEAKLEGAISQRSHNLDEAEVKDQTTNGTSSTKKWVDNSENTQW